MNLETVYDLADLLPPQAKRQYLQLRDAASDSTAIGRGLAERLIEQHQRRQAASTRLAQIRGQRNVDDDHPEMVAQTKALADADAEIARIDSRAATNNLTAGPRATLLRNIDEWLRATAPNHAFEDIEPEPVKLQKGEQIPAGIDRQRRRLRELDADRHRVESAPFPSAHAKALAAAHIDRLAEAATPVVSSLVEHGGPLAVDGVAIEPPIVWATRLAKCEVDVMTDGKPGRGIAIGQQVDTVGLLCWLFRDRMVKRISEAVDAEYDPNTREAALTPTQRAEALATIASDRQAVEFEEAQLLRAAFGAVEARADMEPRAFLLVKAVPVVRQSGFDHAEGIVRGRRAHRAS